jgi:hypothetical protein
VTADGEAEEGGAGGASVDEERSGGESSSRSEHLGGSGNPAEASRSLADPAEHPEQHAALHTGEQGKSEPDEGTDNELLDSEEHSEGGGTFGTADADDESG